MPNVSRTVENAPHFESRLNSACRIVLAYRKARATSQPDETTPTQRESDSLYLFRSYEIEEFDPYNHPRNFGKNIDQSIWAVCRATIADPAFFEISERDEFFG